MQLVGITGGIGSGKSTAARAFESRGIPVVDADRIGHEVIAPGGLAEAGVLEAFGEGILTDGAIDRAKLGALVFEDPARLALLNERVHPHIFARIASQCAGHAESGATACIIDAALLAEGETREPWLSRLILVSAPEDLRIRRLVEQRGLDEADARARIRAQRDPEKKRALADWVINNDGTLEHLQQQVALIARELTEQDASL